MFRRALIFCLLTLALCGACLIGWALHVPETDYLTYRELIESSTPTQLATAPKKKMGMQSREGVEKHVWYMRDQARIHMRTQADRSTLHYPLGGDMSKVYESMDEVQLLMQEELYTRLPDGRRAHRQANGRLLIKGADPKDPKSWVKEKSTTLIPMQQVRQVDATHARYYYSTNLLMADDVALSRFFAPGHELKAAEEGAEFLLKGAAQSVEFALDEKDVNFTAEQFTATLFSDEALL